MIKTVFLTLRRHDLYPGTTSFRPPKKYFVLFYLLSSPVALVTALCYLESKSNKYRAIKF